MLKFQAARNHSINGVFLLRLQAQLPGEVRLDRKFAACAQARPRYFAHHPGEAVRIFGGFHGTFRRTASPAIRLKAEANACLPKSSGYPSRPKTDSCPNFARSVTKVSVWQASERRNRRRVRRVASARGQRRFASARSKVSLKDLVRAQLARVDAQGLVLTGSCRYVYRGCFSILSGASQMRTTGEKKVKRKKDAARNSRSAYKHRVRLLCSFDSRLRVVSEQLRETLVTRGEQYYSETATVGFYSTLF